MKTTSFRARALSCALLTSTAYCGMSAQPAQAQQGLAPQKEYYLGEGEVDLWRGVFLYSNMDLSIGGSDAEGGLTFTRYYGIEDLTSLYSDRFTHSLAVYVHRTKYNEDGLGPGHPSYYLDVVVGRTSERFDLPYGDTQPYYMGQNGPTLTSSGGANGPFTFTARDGTVINFASILCPQGGTALCNGVATSMVRPDGTTVSFGYEMVNSVPRLRLVTTNRGFGMGFEYGSTRITRVCALNLALTYASVGGPCPAGVPSATYTYTSSNIPRIQTFTDPRGQTTSYTYDPLTYGIATIRGPGSSVDDLTVTYNSTTYRVASQTYANGATWTYAYQQTNPPTDSPSNEWTEVTSPLGHKVRHDFAFGAPPKPGSVTDPLGRVTQFRWIADRPGMLERKVEPEGNYVRHSYATRGNLTETRKVAKPGSGLPDIVDSASFPASCTNQKTCNKPDYVIDARGNRTDFTYDPTHGGVTGVTGPADANGARPQTRYAYSQKYAWVKDALGNLVQAASPVWVLTEEAQCKTAGATPGGPSPCAATADEVKVQYDWGSAPGALLLRGKVVDPGGLNLRTCYGYDERGNKISETSPRAGLTSCP